MFVRWHQTADYGYAPNPSMNNTFMAVAMDTYDEEGGNNPRYKQIVAERLSISGGNVAYGLTAQPTNGPYPIEVHSDYKVSRSNSGSRYVTG